MSPSWVVFFLPGLVFLPAACTCSLAGGDCSSPLQSWVTDNLVGVLPGLELEEECREACRLTEGCSYYTHHSLSSPTQPGDCLLLSRLQEPVTPCSHCATGTLDCSRRCIFLMEGGSRFNSQLVTARNSTVMSVALGDCDLTVVAVGGGGRGRYSGEGGGGGSGWVEYTTVSLTGSNLL